MAGFLYKYKTERGSNKIGPIRVWKVQYVDIRIALNFLPSSDSNLAQLIKNILFIYTRSVKKLTVR